MPNVLLPRLSENAIIAPTKAGQWEDAAGLERSRFLKGLSDGLAVAEEDRRVQDIYNIDSIPDVWARPILFRMALFTTKGFDANLHKKVLGEWRALLAMLALQDMRHLPITVEAVHLDQSDQLGKTLLMLAPQDSVGLPTRNSPWNDIYVISYTGKPLAITSPTTLVATSADYGTALEGQLTEPWSDNGQYLTDPIPHLIPNELSGLHMWLKELDNSLRNSIPANVQTQNETCSQLLKTLDEYIKDVHNALNGNFPSAGNLIDAGLNMHIGLSQFLNKKVQAAPPKPSDSAVLLRTTGARQGTKPLLLVSQQMLQHLSVSRGVSLAQIVVWTGITAADVKNHSLTNDKTMINGVPLNGAEWRRPEEFFTDRLVIHSGGNALKSILKVPGSDLLSQEDMSVILPLRSEILDYFTPQEIVRNCRLEKSGNEIKVEFTFPISGINKTGAEYRVEKSYPMQEVLFLLNNVPIIELWPNFKRPGWDKYYLYYENSDAQNMVQGAGYDYLYVYPWAYGKNIAGDTPNQGLANRYTARLSGFPEALICTTNSMTEGGIYAGIVLLEEPEPVAAQMGNVWQVGVDFGTSSTMLFCRSGKGNPKPLALQPNLFQVTESGEMRARTYRNFIPSSTKDQQEGSFLSIFQLLNGDLLHGKIPNIRPLQDGNVFWLLSADGTDAEDFRNNSSQIDTNLKWGSDQISQLKLSAFVKQICLQILAEAAKNGVGAISWNFSYPTAFSPNQTMTFQTTCRNAVQEAMQDSGFIVHEKPEFWPESKAGAYYFNQLGGIHFAGGAVCLDIGAGTTDISVISGEPAKIVYHTSLQFAGRYLFQSIYKHYDIFASSLELGGMGKEQRNALIDADLRKHSDEYQYGLTHMTVRGDVQKVLQLTQFAAAGLFYYIGGLVSLLHEKGIYQGNEVPDIYVGGNGSRIFPWICGGMFTDDNPYLTVFQDMLVAASGLQLGDAFQMVLSDTPKVEVARGMIENKPFNHGSFFNALQIAQDLFGRANGQDVLIANSVFAGDDFAVNDEPRKKSEFISAYDIEEGISIQNVGEFRAFTNKFNANQYIWGEHIDINNRDFARVLRSVQGAYSAQRGNDPHKIFVEPIFILELKGFMELVAHA